MRTSLHLENLRSIRWQDYAVRFALGAAISGAAGLAAQAAGDWIGGMFLAFPAILPASLTLVSEEDGKGAAMREDAGAVFGVLGLFPFAAVLLMWGARAPGEAVVGALVVWSAISLGLYKLRESTAERGRAPGGRGASPSCR